MFRALLAHPQVKIFLLSGFEVSPSGIAGSPNVVGCRAVCFFQQLVFKNTASHRTSHAGYLFLGVFAKLLKGLLASSCLSVRPSLSLTACLPISVSQYGTTRFPLHGFYYNFMFEYFSKICRENSSFISIYKNNEYFT
jgi:hypothetical protein